MSANGGLFGGFVGESCFELCKPWRRFATPTYSHGKNTVPLGVFSTAVPAFARGLDIGFEKIPHLCQFNTSNGRTNFILKIKEKETRLSLFVHDDDDNPSNIWYIHSRAHAHTHTQLFQLSSNYVLKGSCENTE